jgi:hypothetical protein
MQTDENQYLKLAQNGPAFPFFISPNVEVLAFQL